MLTYLVLSLLMAIFTPEIGEGIAQGLNHAWGSNMSGMAIWFIGLVVAIFLD
jgi:hypothetical protein